MKSPIILLLALLSFSLSCSSSERMATTNVAQQKDVAQMADVAKTQNYGAATEKVSLNDVDKERSTAEAADRKIIRNADITIEVPSTTNAQHQVTSIAESHGGFVVTSEAKQRALLVLLPSGLVIRYVMRRAKRMRLAQALATPAAE